MRCILDLVTQMYLFSLSNTHRAGENDLTCLPEIINIFAQGREPFLSQKNQTIFELLVNADRMIQRFFKSYELESKSSLLFMLFYLQ